MNILKSISSPQFCNSNKISKFVFFQPTILTFLLQTLPVFVGVGVVAITAILAKILLNRKQKKITLEDPNVKYALKLVEKINVSHDTRKFVFSLPSENHILGLPVGN